MITLPGLIDPHVHFRTPGQSYKEDFTTGTKAALAGGYTAVLDMPNNKSPVTSYKLLVKKREIARRQIVSDIGFYFGSLGDNLDEFEKVRNHVLGLKLYLNKTTGNFIIDKKSLIRIYDAWPAFVKTSTGKPRSLPILVHAEEDVINLVIEVCKKTKKKTHICHVSTSGELKSVIKAKKRGLPITCGVTPHHLFLTKKDAKKLGPYGLVKPSIDKTDKDFLWNNLEYIDVIESDHAPHTISEKKSSEPPFGMPGLETTLGLLLRAYYQDCLSINDIKRMCHDNPTKIFGIKQNAKIIVDENEEWEVKGSDLYSKSKWSPFEGWKLKGKVKKVYIREKLVFDNGKILVKPGWAKVLK